MKAIWNNEVIAESNDTVVVDGNHYFPSSSVTESFLKPVDKTTYCPWKGRANYYTLTVGGTENKNAAWYYPTPKASAQEIEGRIAFWKGVQVIE